jgi:stearoyl-CoA desaturase (delta-9 desaturase)
VTGDDSRNNPLLALITMGEGWHNNHHACPSSARQGFRWWEVDMTFYLLRLLALAGIVRDLKAPPARVLSNEQQLGMRVVQRTAEQLAARFDPERIATAVAAALHAIDLSALQQTLAEARGRTVETLAGLNLPHLPSRADLLVQARAMFARTPSFDEIVDRGHALLFAAIGDHLLAAVPARR